MAHENRLPKDIINQYNTEFDCKRYLADYTPYAGSYFDQLVCTYQFMSKDVDLKGKKLLDAGTGASIWMLTIPAGLGLYIIASDCCDAQRDHLNKWLNGEDDAFDWHETVKSALLAEGRHDSLDSIIEREQLIRQQVKEVLYLNFMNEKPLETDQGQFDIVSTSFSLECAVDTEEDYRIGFNNLASLVKKGGYLLMVATFEDAYMVGEVKFKHYSLTPAVLKECFEQNNFTIRYENRSEEEEEAHHLIEGKNYYCIMLGHKC